MVVALAGLGMPQDEISLLIINPETGNPIDAKTLRKAFRYELRAGSAKVKAEIARTLFQMATEDKSVSAALFLAKSRRIPHAAPHLRRLGSRGCGHVEAAGASRLRALRRLSLDERSFQMATPRGIRNNNPGNLRRSDDHWAGLAAEQSDPNFFQFSEPIFGLRALARTLYNYQAKHGLETIRGIIARWAPTSENDTEAYVAAVSADMGAGADEPLDLDDGEELAALTKAVVRHENGEQPYSDELIAQAVRSARA